MAINPADITTVRVDQLASDPITLTSLLPHQVGTDLKQDTVQALVDLVATAIGAGSGVGYLPISVTDGQQLPSVPSDPSFFLCGAGTYLNINGFPNVICTGELNAVMSLTDHWELAVEIPIVAEVGVQTVTGSAVDNTDPLNPVINEIIDGVQTIVAGTNVTVDNTDPLNPIVSATGGGGSQTLQQVTDEGNETTQHIKVKLIDETDEYISEITPNYIEVSKRDIASSDIIRNAFDVNSITRFNTLEGSYSINLTEASDAVPTLVQRVLKAPILTADATIATLNDIEFIVVSSSRTASNDTNYSVVANATFTDPTPVEGKGYIVFVRNGTATIGGVGYTAGRNVYRFFHSGAWSSVVYVDKDYVDAKVQNSLTASTTIAPSATAVNTALGLKQRTLKDFDTKEGFYLFEDFIGNPANSNFNSFGVSTSVSGAGASCLPNTTYPNRTNQQGVI
jgi:hypothetical protein